MSQTTHKCIVTETGSSITVYGTSIVGNVSVRFLQRISITNVLFTVVLYLFFCTVPHSYRFYPRDAMLARSLRQRRVRPSVYLSVTRRYCA